MIKFRPHISEDLEKIKGALTKTNHLVVCLINSGLHYMIISNVWTYPERPSPPQFQDSSVPITLILIGLSSFSK